MRLLGLALVVLHLLAGTAQARRETSLRYPFSLVWTTAVRMVRVDYESPITEKDRDEGYFLFDFVYEGKTHSGSFEVVRDGDESSGDARVIVQIPQMPSYFEQMLIDKLQRKLAQEHGAPREKPPEKKPAAPSAPPSDQEQKPATPPAEGEPQQPTEKQEPKG
jgi:hypothetical protein